MTISNFAHQETDWQFHKSIFTLASFCHADVHQKIYYVQDALMQASVASVMSLGYAIMAPVSTSGANPIAFKLPYSSMNLSTCNTGNSN